ncbi:hypothetical protein BH24ACI5_BH24ACI5_22810 [soil metagenome]
MICACTADPDSGVQRAEGDPVRARSGEGDELDLPEAGRVRLRPILMTTFALIAGMVPVALGVGEGADFRAPLGIAVIGGVITSTILTLLVIPTVYEILADSRDWLSEKFGVKKAGPGNSPEAVRVSN